MVTQRVDNAAAANFGLAIVNAQNADRFQLVKGLKEHTGGIIYY